MISQECCVWYATKLKIYINDMEMDVNRFVCGMCVFFGGIEISDDFFRHDARDKHKIGVNDDDNGNDDDDDDDNNV